MITNVLPPFYGSQCINYYVACTPRACLQLQRRLYFTLETIESSSQMRDSLALQTHTHKM